MLMCDPELLNITNNVIMGKISLSEIPVSLFGK